MRFPDRDAPRSDRPRDDHRDARPKMSMFDEIAQYIFKERMIATEADPAVVGLDSLIAAQTFCDQLFSWRDLRARNLDPAKNWSKRRSVQEVAEEQREYRENRGNR